MSVCTVPTEFKTYQLIFVLLCFCFFLGGTLAQGRVRNKENVQGLGGEVPPLLDRGVRTPHLPRGPRPTPRVPPPKVKFFLLALCAENLGHFWQFFVRNVPKMALLVNLGAKFLGPAQSKVSRPNSRITHTAPSATTCWTGRGGGHLFYGTLAHRSASTFFPRSPKSFPASKLATPSPPGVNKRRSDGDATSDAGSVAASDH